MSLSGEQQAELQTQLASYQPSSSDSSMPSARDLSQFGLGGLTSSTDLTASLRDLYKQMGETQEGFPPMLFLNSYEAASELVNKRSTKYSSRPNVVMTNELYDSNITLRNL